MAAFISTVKAGMSPGAARRWLSFSIEISPSGAGLALALAPFIPEAIAVPAAAQRGGA